MTNAERVAAALADRYRIDSRLGEGGMATVYLAEDLKHDRKVAVKVLRPELAAVLGAERFVQEIKTTASLQHPHILPLFDSGEADGFLYYVMPYIEGETLRDKLNRETQLGIDEAVKIATEVADALDYAHRNNVIHRDIKPENILLHDGRPMVADFGIALAVSAAAGGRMTETGLSLGTPHYMSPEQATAEKEITARSDVYSLGSVLYEMLSGEPPHMGTSAQAIIMKIVTDSARPITELRKSVPANVAAAVAKALEKLPADRFDRASAFGAALTDTNFVGDAAAAPHPADRPGREGVTLPRWAIAAGLIVIGAAAGWMLRPEASPEPAPVVRFTVPVPEGHELLDFFPNVAVSPDGMTLAYFAGNQLVLHSLERGVAEARSLDDLSVVRCCLTFSPDGRWVLFGSSGDRGELWGAPTAGGPVVDFWSRPVEHALVHATWDEGIWIRRAGDETWTPVTTLDGAAGDGAHLWPQLLGEGRYLLYTIMGPGMMWNGASVVLKDLDGGEQTTIATSATHGRYVPTGHVVYIRAEGTIEAVPFDLDRREVTGDPILVEEGVRTAYWGGAASFAVSDAGTFAFVRGSSWRLHQLTWVDRRGNVLEQVGTPITVEGIRLSPDGRYGVTYVASPNADIARFELATGEPRRLTFDPTTEDNPIWSPDGGRIAYRRTVAGNDQRILAISADGTGAPEELFAAEQSALPRDWSPDGSAILLNAGEPLAVLELATGRVDTLTRGRSSGGSFSPDGRWIAYSSDETGRFEVYIVGYPGLTGKQQVSRSGGRVPQWSSARSEIFFVNQDTMMVTRVSTSPRVEWTTPEPLFTVPDLVGLVDIAFGVSADGQRILYPARNPGAAAREIHVVVNWFEELRRRSDGSDN